MRGSVGKCPLMGRSGASHLFFFFSFLIHFDYYSGFLFFEIDVAFEF